MVISITKEIWIAFISAMLGALASFYIPKLLTSDKVELEYAPIYKEKFINVPELLGGRVEISVDGRTQDNLSVLDVYLFNRSHKDLKDIPITFEFYIEGQSDLPKLLGKQLKIPDTFPKDSITEMPLADANHVRYKISSLPVTANYDTDFIASFVFLGKSAPKVRVQSDYVDNKVISIFEYDKKKRERNELIVVFFVFILLVILFVGWLIWDSKRSKDRFLEKLGNASEKLGEFGISKEQIRKIAIESYKIATSKTNKTLQRR